MSQHYRIYLDACCLNRPFDEQTQPRIALETQSILSILSQCESGIGKLITSTALEVNASLIQVAIDNPIQWLLKTTHTEDTDNA